MTISIELSDEEVHLLEDIAKRKDVTVSELVRRLVMERIEDEYDLEVFREYQNKKKNGTLKTRPLAELLKELEL